MGRPDFSYLTELKEKQKKELANIGGPAEPGESSTVQLPVPDYSSLNQPVQQQQPPYIKERLGGGSTSRIGYDPTQDIAKKQTEMEKIYGYGDESYASKLLKSREEAKSRELGYKYGLGSEEIEAGIVPEKPGGLAGKKIELYTEMEETKNNLSNMYKERLKELQGYEDKSGKKVSGSIGRIKSSLSTAEAEVQRAYNEIKSANVNPMKGIPMWSIALIGLGAGLQELGRKGSGNTSVNVLNTLISKRQEAKRLELQKLFDIHKLSVQQRDYFSNLFERKLSEQSNLMKNIAIMDEAKLAIRERSLDYQINVADKINAIAASKAEDEYKIRATSAQEMDKAKEFEIKTKLAAAPKTTSTWREQVIPLKGKGGELKDIPNDAKKSFVQSLNSLDQIKKLKKSYIKHKPWKYSFWGTMSNSERYKADLNRATASYVYSVSGAAATDKEREFHKKTFATGFGPGETNQKDGIYKLNQHMNEVASKIAQNISMYPELMNKVPKAFRNDVFKHLLRIKREDISDKYGTEYKQRKR